MILTILKNSVLLLFIVSSYQKIKGYIMQSDENPSSDSTYSEEGKLDIIYRL